MKLSIIPQAQHTEAANNDRLIDRLARRLVLDKFKNIKTGELLLIEGDNCYTFGTPHPELSRVKVTVNNPRFYSNIAFGGSVAAGESYFYQYWECNHLVDLVRLFIRNRSALDSIDSSKIRLQLPLQKLLHFFNRNTRQGSQRNIEAHYDLGNPLFATFLDDTMMYSCAVFDKPSTTLYEAQIAKLDKICRALELKESDHLLEIGTGWGGLAVYAAKIYGCRVTTTTISREQYEFAKKRVKDAGVEDKVTLLLEDYRDLSEMTGGRTYDKLVSIEMIEAVGHDNQDEFFSTCDKLLKPGGLMLLQAITITDQRYEAALSDVDFIQRYIFPGSFIPAISYMLQSVRETTSMKLCNLEDIGLHYARTLREWRLNFFRNIRQVKSLGCSQEFIRMWEFYLCYCEGGFEERALGDVQMLLAKSAD
jgi:cyclopropane-fatty-acyl-phospholipid synthase